MKRFVEGEDRGQSTLFPECLDDWVDEDNPVRVIDVFVDELDLGALDFGGVDPKATGRPSYHPSILLKLYVYGYLNRVQSSRRLEREAGRNVEVMWLTGRLVPDHKTIADFRKDNGAALALEAARNPGRCRLTTSSSRPSPDAYPTSTVCDLSHMPAKNSGSEEKSSRTEPLPEVRDEFLPQLCASASKGDPTPSAYQGLDFPIRIPGFGGAPIGADGDPTTLLVFVNLSEC
jgi:transposase